MLTVNLSSFCDVCAEEYGPRNQPYSIPCGHVLCRRCCNAITEKTPARLSPVCPFCREHFTPESVRVIRTEYSSGISTPAPEHPYQDAWSSSSHKRGFSPAPERSGTSSRIRGEAKKLEDKVARVAGQKSSVEEVSKLHDELQAWLTSSASQEEAKDKMTSLYLSAALLRAILMNHFAFAEVTKTAKNVEASLKGKVDDLEIKNEKLEAELRKQRQQYSAKAQECQNLRSELSRLKALTSMLGVPSDPAVASDASRATSPLSPPPSTPASPSERAPSTTPFARYTPTHSRSSSHASTLRSATPSHSLRPTTPATLRTYTPAPPTPSRSHTPSISSRSKTPAPTTPSSSSRSRRTSVTSPSYQSPPPVPKMVRTTSDERDPYSRPPSVDPGPPPLTRLRYPSISRAFSLSRS